MIRLKDILEDIDFKKIKFFYHATNKKNLVPILNGGIKSNYEGVFLADSFQNAAKFLVIRGQSGNIIVFRIKGNKLNKNKLYESFDHDENFFKCKAYIYDGDIDKSWIDINKIMTY